MTNFEKVKNMTEEELANWIAYLLRYSSESIGTSLGVKICETDLCPYIKTGICNEDTYDCPMTESEEALIWLRLEALNA